MDDLVAWLRQQFDEDERVAREAADAARSGEWLSGAEGSVISNDPRSELHIRGAVLSLDDIGVHIARWDPARVLAKVEADRRIFDHLATWLTVDDEYDPVETTLRAEAKEMLRAFAQPYAGQPGWREEWQV